MGDYKIVTFTKQLAIKHQLALTSLLRLIPQVEYDDNYILLEEKSGRAFLGKWEHSLIALDINNNPIAVLIAYERKLESNGLYPVNTLYINEVCVSPVFQGQGIAKALLTAFINKGKKGFKYLKGDVIFAVQTNSAYWNKNVQELYAKFGFRKVGEKVYDNRIDNIYFLK